MLRCFIEKDLESVHALEAQLDVAEHWTVASPKCVSTVVEIKKRKYQLALDALELLIVERIFELTKMNQSETVVEYTFLADFDILRDTRAEVRSRPWTRPAYQLAMDRYFKILRAREEIKKLNVEIPRMVTWIRDEYKVLRRKEQELEVEAGKTEEQVEADQGLALQVL
ncbi:hypothetical protein B0H14DRAFT_3767311 [Mycena olivaceomarginata]|nr:hypothetical protein B0H14DRAFT_3767311 [Mycena olivaceomarginata]